MSRDARPDNKIVRCPACGAWLWKPDKVCLRCGATINPE